MNAKLDETINRVDNIEKEQKEVKETVYRVETEQIAIKEKINKVQTEMQLVSFKVSTLIEEQRDTKDIIGATVRRIGSMEGNLNRMID